MESCKRDDNLSQPLGTNAFDSEMVEAAFIYHQAIAHGQTRRYIPVAFNREVDRYNTLNQRLKDGIDAFKASVNDYNAELARVGTPID